MQHLSAFWRILICFVTSGASTAFDPYICIPFSSQHLGALVMSNSIAQFALLTVHNNRLKRTTRAFSMIILVQWYRISSPNPTNTRFHRFSGRLSSSKRSCDTRRLTR